MVFIVELILLVTVFAVLIKTGEGINNRYYRKAFEGGILLWLLLIVWKLLHWEGDNLVAIAAALILFGSKALSLTKQKPVVMDFVILLWLTVYLFYSLAVRSHLLYIPEALRKILNIVELLLLVVTASGLFFYDKKKQHA